MPMPPALAKDLAYSSVRNERQMPVAPLPPNGPSPSRPVNICWNMLFRNTASKSCAAAFALALPASELPPALALSLAAAAGLALEQIDGVQAGRGQGVEDGLLPSHHLDVGLDGAGGLDRLQDGDQIARADAERIEAVDQLLQRDAVA